MDDPILDFLRSQAHNYRCRVCGSNHKGSQLRKIGQHNNRVVVQVVCGRCRDSFFLHIQFGSLIDEPETAAPRVPSPRDAEDLDGDPLSADEVLDAREQLAGFRGKLTDLLS